MVAASTSSCGDCSPQCLDCRIRGYTRLSLDQSTADCYLEVAVIGGATCPGLGDGIVTPAIPGTPVCRRQRCTLENGERCRLKRLNEDTCNSAVSHANFALDSTLSGCFSYIDGVATTGTSSTACPEGYILSCRYPNVQDNLPSSDDINPNAVYSVVPDAPVLVEQLLNPVATPSCPLTCRDPVDGRELTLIIEGCLVANSSFVNDIFAQLLNQNLFCGPHYTPLIVSGIAGCYKVEQRLESGACNVFRRKAGDELVAGEQAPEVETAFPTCFYRLSDNDIDPTGCDRRHQE